MHPTTTRTTRPGVLPLAVLLAAVLGACSSTQPLDRQAEDAALETEIKARVAADPELNPFEIAVDVDEGVVRLHGMVDDAGDREKAGDLARRVDGVVRVVNEITYGEESVSDRLDDGALTARVKARLAADPEVNPMNVDVDTENGVVTLSGRVETAEERDRAERLARETEGVASVRNLLEVGDLTGG
jgi:hyperosmotically inducible protein